MSTVGRLTIDLAAIARNWSLLDKKVGNNECGAVVKADAYGLGVEKVSQALFQAGCRVFFVATLTEAKELRGFLPEGCRIIVLGGLSHDSELDSCSPDWVRYQLVPVLFSPQHITRWASFCSSANEALPCCIKIDTGMHRLGLLPADVDQINNELWENINPLYIMSHFACADAPEHPLNKRQIDDYEQTSKKLRGLFPNIKQSLANSSGMFLPSCPVFDLARPGSALYGINPTPTKENPMSAVVSLKLPIMQLKTINIGDAVGYGAEFVASQTTTIAVVFGGYADGLFRSLANKGSAYFGGHKVPIIGRVSMDSLAVDVTGIDGIDQDAQNSIDIFGPNQSLDDLALAAGTIGYELLTSLGARYERIYTDSSVCLPKGVK